MQQRIASIIIMAALSGTAASSSRAQGLQPESKDEFRRVYGVSGGTATPAPTLPARTAVNPALAPESVAEFRRIFGQNVLAGTAQMQKFSSPSTLNSTILSLLTENADTRRFFILWHLISVDLTAIDHRALIEASPSSYHEQFGPARTARALALIHQAMFEAANVFEQKYASTLSPAPAFSKLKASRDAAIVESAYQMIGWLYPGLLDQTLSVGGSKPVCVSPGFNLLRYYTCSMDAIPDDEERKRGIEVGRAIAGRLIAERSHDGSERTEPIWGRDFVPRTLPGSPDYPFLQWQIDPVSKLNTALGGFWGQVRPFAMSAGFQFRPGEDKSPSARVPEDSTGQSNFPDLPSYNVILRLGGENRLASPPHPTESIQAHDGLFLAQFWAYDATANLCAPARLYNQVAAAVLGYIETHSAKSYTDIDTKSTLDVARYYALINFAMADASIAAWDAKFYFQFPRPVTYIRALQAKGPVAPQVIDPPKWYPVGAQVTNSDSPFNITPPFPSYPSGHAVFGGALFGILRQYIDPGIRWNFLSDEFNGKNKDVFNYVRCSQDDPLTPSAKFCRERAFSVDCAERENADSRLFMGVHWVFDADDGIVMGNKVARQVYRTMMRRIDAQGHPVDPASHTFSISADAGSSRSKLVCPGVDLPSGWDDEDATKGFGKLSVSVIQ